MFSYMARALLRRRVKLSLYRICKCAYLRFQVVVLVSDGHSNSEPGETTRAANALKSTGQVSIFAVGVGDEPDMAALALVASDPQSRYLLRLTRRPPNDITTVAEQLLDSICNP